MTKHEVFKLIRECGGVTAAAEAAGIARGTLRSMLEQWMVDIILNGEEGEGIRDKEVLEDSVRARKQLQKYRDVSRVERKAFREHARVENAVSDYAREIREILAGHEFAEGPEPGRCDADDAPVLIVHWSDQHLNERVELPHNRYDWRVAAARLRKHVNEAKRIADAYGASSIFVAMTGDLLNSDRRLDELMANAGNRAKACVLAVDLYQQALRDLSSHCRVTVGSVSGNESRIPKDVGWSAEVASDNYDFTIYEQLALLLAETDIGFLPVHDPGEMLVDLAGQHCLFIHGHGALDNNIQKAVQAAKGRWSARGVRVDLMFWGHVHEALVADSYARSASLVGTNDYAEKALNLTGRASQNLYVVLPGGGFHGIKVDLQETGEVVGYDIAKRLETYNTKSAAKLRPEHTIHRVVI